MEEFYMVDGPAQGEIVEKKSRFIANVFPVDSEEQALEIVEKTKKQYWDARHNCFAFVIGKNNEVQRFSDDGEPQGTAGKPILEVLTKGNIHNTLIIVTRYFGGTLLGAGGLIRAYSHASKIAIDAGHIITMAPCKVISVSVDYSFYDRLNILLNEFSANIENSEFTDSVTVIFSIRENTVSLLQDKLTQLSNGKYLLKEIGEKFAKVE